MYVTSVCHTVRSLSVCHTVRSPSVCRTVRSPSVCHTFRSPKRLPYSLPSVCHTVRSPKCLPYSQVSKCLPYSQISKYLPVRTPRWLGWVVRGVKKKDLDTLSSKGIDYVLLFLDCVLSRAVARQLHKTCLHGAYPCCLDYDKQMSVLALLPAYMEPIHIALTVISRWVYWSYCLDLVVFKCCVSVCVCFFFWGGCLNCSVGGHTPMCGKHCLCVIALLL